MHNLMRSEAAATSIESSKSKIDIVRSVRKQHGILKKRNRCSL
ncbi:hypothetical protein [Bacillus sp. P14.5]|nr:hypothetical protein [Bacillus sp. P14.5]